MPSCVSERCKFFFFLFFFTSDTHDVTQRLFNLKFEFKLIYKREREKTWRRDSYIFFEDSVI